MTSEERRASIVEAACRLFAEKGFRGVTTRELAASIGVTEPVLYEHFRTKRELYSAIIEDKASEGMQALEKTRARFADSADDYAFFTELADSILDWYTQDPAFVRLLLFSSLEGHELKDLFHDRIRDCFEAVIAYIASRIEAGAVRPVDPAVAARAFFGMIAHYAMTSVVFGYNRLPGSPREVLHQMVRIFINGLCKQDGNK